METKLAGLIRRSPFDSVRDAYRFIEWSEEHDCHTDWDRDRLAMAREIIKARDDERSGVRPEPHP